ncbi:hypothetical protein [Nonomuraea sp. KM88]|uniref:hypothetical protein n=1 Tax=Nonomuraea sp. KM88 TaxID=3457427 RepID=UPI003FCE0408
MTTCASRDLVPEADEVYMVQLLVERDERQRRRLTRAKQTTQEWRDRVDLADTGDATIAADQDGYRYLGVDNTGLTPEQTVAVIKRAIPAIYGSPPPGF